MAVQIAYGNGQGIHPRGLHEAHRLVHIGEHVGRIDAGVSHLAQFGLHVHAGGLGYACHLTGDGHILLKRKGCSVEHHRSEPQPDGLDTGFEALAVVQVHTDGYGGLAGCLQEKRSHEVERSFWKLYLG